MFRIDLLAVRAKSAKEGCYLQRRAMRVSLLVFCSARSAFGVYRCQMVSAHGLQV